MSINHSCDYNTEMNNMRDEITVRERLAKLEKGSEYQHEQLLKIETDVKEIKNILENIKDQFKAHSVVSAIKSKIWVIIYSSITVFATLGVHTVIFKHWGFV